MQAVLEFAGFAVALWREVLGAAAGVALASIASIAFPGQASAVWFVLAFLGASVGVVWHVAAVSAKEASQGIQQPTVSPFVSFLGIAGIGGLWGTVIESAAGPIAAAACLVVAPAVLGSMFGAFTKRRVQVSTVAFSTAAALVGYATPPAIQFLFQASGA